jgi:MbtH protein
MSHDDTEEVARDAAHRVVLNDEEQYSLWPVDSAIPPGWRDAGKAGSKEDCLAYISTVWTDMRPLSLRKKMQQEA